MCIKIKEKVSVFILVLFLIILYYFILKADDTYITKMAGGDVRIINIELENEKAVFNSFTEEKTVCDSKRPSSEPAINTKYLYRDVEKDPNILKNIKDSQEVIYAYYGVLKEASNMLEYSGGCGSIGNGNLPYPYAYELLTEDKKKETSLEEFEKSFEGIGHINLLKINPAYIPENTPSNIKYYMIETEFITGKKDVNAGISLFEYYYGLVTVEESNENGWKIKDIKYIPQAFLCAPYHGWSYCADALIQIIYMDRYKVIDKIDNKEIIENKIYIYASGNDKKYRFDFVILTNGYNILLHENVYENNEWKETNLLKPEDQIYKLSILNPQLK